MDRARPRVLKPRLFSGLDLMTSGVMKDHGGSGSGRFGKVTLAAERKTVGERGLQAGRTRGC